MLVDKINKLKNWQAAIVILIVGFTVFWTGLTNQFLGDDNSQIINNPVVHSISHIKFFFEGGTFYTGHGLAPLSGAYYRPLMTTGFSFIYTIFGPHPVYFHLVQLLICIGSAIILYLFFRYSFKPVLALFLALVFLVHPLNSQVVFAAASLQDALFFFFGILAMWLLIRFRSIKSLGLVALSLFLCLLSKETAVVFIAVALLYLFWWNRKRLLLFIGSMVLPVVLWLVLKIHAIGLLGANPNNAPIDHLSLIERLMTAPSVLLFYITKFVFPWRLASGYYWTYPHFSVRHVLLPLVIDLLVIALAVYGALVIRRRATKAQYYTYLFFGVWTGLGLLTTLQIVPLDMTVCETWFYFSMAGVLGMVGIAVTAIASNVRVNRNVLLLCALILLVVLGVRTAVRGTNWRDSYTLASHDIQASKEDFNAYKILASKFTDQGNFSEAQIYAQHSASIYPTADNNNLLGLALEAEGHYSEAIKAYNNGLRHGQNAAIYENEAHIVLLHGSPAVQSEFLAYAIQKFPTNANLWIDAALVEAKNGDNTDAKIAITKAANYGPVPQELYSNIMNDRSFKIVVDNSPGGSLTIK